MTAREFCLHKTRERELVVIRDNGWITASVWIDCEDIFAMPDRYKNLEVKGDSWGRLTVVDKSGDTVEIPCHYIDV